MPGNDKEGLGNDREGLGKDKEGLGKDKEGVGQCPSLFVILGPDPRIHGCPIKSGMTNPSCLGHPRA